MNRKIPLSSRTPLFRALRKAMRIAGCSRKQGSSDPGEMLGLWRQQQWTRREFLKSLGAGACIAGVQPLLSACGSGSSGPDFSGTPEEHGIVIVGAGMAGLNAAYQLKKAGVNSVLYEAATRAGGRMFSARNLLAPGLVTELGGEFIDSIHEDMLDLAAEFGLGLIDTQTDPLPVTYFFGGRHYTEGEIIEAFLPLAARIEADYNSTGEIVDFENEGGASALDRMSIAEYLDAIGAAGFIRQLLEVAYVTEYGLDAAEQSALNLIFLIGTDLSSGFEIFGESDERYKILGGNDLITTQLAAALEGQIHLEHRLEGIRENASGYQLAFENANGGSTLVQAEVLILCLPFSILRDIEFEAELPPVKRKAIAELGYGTNAKVLVGYSGRPWRDQGFNGEAFSDEAFQLCWDNSQLQGGSAGGLTYYSGGKPGLSVGSGTAESQAARFQPGIERLYPGASALLNGTVQRFHWPSYPFTRGSYAAYKPGQWTSIAGAEIIPIGNIFFAGEHCSYDFQGYMNGAAETGRRAAEAVLERMGGERAERARNGNFRSNFKR